MADRAVLDQAGHGSPDQIRPRILLVGGCTADTRARAVAPRRGGSPVRGHGCWLLTEMISPLI